MSYQVRLRRAARKQLDGLAGRDYRAVATAISHLEHEPRPRRVRKLAESGLWRTRVGRYRVIYTINDDEHLIVVVRVAGRSGATYRGL